MMYWAKKKDSKKYFLSIMEVIRGEVSLKFDFISKPKNVCLSTETGKNCLVSL